MTRPVAHKVHRPLYATDIFLFFPWPSHCTERGRCRTQTSPSRSCQTQTTFPSHIRTIPGQRRARVVPAAPASWATWTPSMRIPTAAVLQARQQATRGTEYGRDREMDRRVRMSGMEMAIRVRIHRKRGYLERKP